MAAEVRVLVVGAELVRVVAEVRGQEEVAKKGLAVVAGQVREVAAETTREVVVKMTQVGVVKMLLAEVVKMVLVVVGDWLRVEADWQGESWEEHW